MNLRGVAIPSRENQPSRVLLYFKVRPLLADPAPSNEPSYGCFVMHIMVRPPLGCVDPAVVLLTYRTRR